MNPRCSRPNPLVSTQSVVPRWLAPACALLALGLVHCGAKTRSTHHVEAGDGRAGAGGDGGPGSAGALSAGGQGASAGSSGWNAGSAGLTCPPTADGTGGATAVAPCEGMRVSEVPSESTTSLAASYALGTPPVDLLFVVDRSTAMSQGPFGDSATRLEAVRRGFEAFLDLPDVRGARVGLITFPKAAVACDAESYGTPDVPIQALSTAAPKLQAALAAPPPGPEAREALPALSGAHAYAEQWAASEGAGRTVLTVLITASEPVTCDPSRSVDEALLFFAARARESPRVRTFVLGLGEELGALDSLALAGDTTRVLGIRDCEGSVGVSSALHAVARTDLACELGDGVVEGSEPDQFAIMRDSSAANAAQRIPQQLIADDCDRSSSGGWYWQSIGGLLYMTLCPCTCAFARQATLEFREFGPFD